MIVWSRKYVIGRHPRDENVQFPHRRRQEIGEAATLQGDPLRIFSRLAARPGRPLLPRAPNARHDRPSCTSSELCPPRYS